MQPPYHHYPDFRFYLGILLRVDGVAVLFVTLLMWLLLLQSRYKSLDVNTLFNELYGEVSSKIAGIQLEMFCRI